MRRTGSELDELCKTMSNALPALQQRVQQWGAKPGLVATLDADRGAKTLPTVAMHPVQPQLEPVPAEERMSLEDTAQAPQRKHQAAGATSGRSPKSRKQGGKKRFGGAENQQALTELADSSTGKAALPELAALEADARANESPKAWGARGQEELTSLTDEIAPAIQGLASGAEAGSVNQEDLPRDPARGEPKEEGQEHEYKKDYEAEDGLKDRDGAEEEGEGGGGVGAAGE